MSDALQEHGAGRPRESEFASETASAPAGPDAYAGRLTDGFTIGGGVNGGLLLAAVARACASRLADDGHTLPLTMSASYLTASAPGPFTVTTDVVREGRSSSVVRATLSQPGADGAPVARVTTLSTFARPETLDAADADSGLPVLALPDIPAVEECLARPRGGADGPGGHAIGAAALLERLDVRLDPDCAPALMGRRVEDPVIQGWLRLADGHVPDPLTLLLAVDALPPVSFALGRPGWAPTVELTAYVRGVPESGWLCVRHETRHVAGGHFEEDAAVWDSTGRLVAQSRQLARLPRSPRGA